MKYLITGGGTGGHIYPALAIAEEVKEEDENADILYVGTKDGLEAELVPNAGFKFTTVRVKGLPRKINKEFFIAIKELVLGLNDSRKIINEFKPDVVIGTGGYVCGPLVLMAALKKIPTLIHEQNAYPGITNKILSRFVDRIAITFDEAKNHFKNKDRVVNTGNPIRKDILKINKKAAYDKLGIKKDAFFILSFGGSGGQRSLNKAMVEVIEKLSPDISLIHITGDRLYDEFLSDIREGNITIADNINILEYLYDMPDALSIADIVVTPAGAITLAEISAIGKPSILTPKSYTAENHQEYNAHFFKEKGASELILEKDLTGEKLFTVIMDLKNNPRKLTTMSKNAKKIGKPEASKNIYNEILSILG